MLLQSWMDILVFNPKNFIVQANFDVKDGFLWTRSHGLKIFEFIKYDFGEEFSPNCRELFLNQF